MNGGVMLRRTWLAVLAFVAFAAGTGAYSRTSLGAATNASRYYPLQHDPSAIEPLWHRWALAFAITQKCNFIDDETKTRLAIAAAQQHALTPATPRDSAPDSDLLSVANTPVAQLCKSVMERFVRAQAVVAKPDYSIGRKAP
jgi:hypothetical protein